MQVRAFERYIPLTVNKLMRSLANTVDPDIMSHAAAFHQCLQCLLSPQNDLH